MSGGSPGDSAGSSLSQFESVVGDPLLEELFPGLAHGVHWGLERMEAFLGATGDPHRTYRSIHVGGTNGKGSVGSMVSTVLSRGNHSVGLYTSPHLCAFRERFQVDGVPITDNELRALVLELRSEIARHELTFFEAATGLAFHYFQRRAVDVAVIEVGLGGRLDATNVIDPLLTTITNIAQDHSEYLGETLPEIAREKAGIIKPGVPLITAENDDEILGLLEATCVQVGAPFISIRPDLESLDVEMQEDHTTFTIATATWGVLRVRTRLVGEHQAINGALSVLMLEQLPPPLLPSREDLLEGIANVRWPGRAQVEHFGGQTWIFDIAHNTAGAQALASVLQRLDLPKPVVLLTAVLGDKDWRSMLPPLFREADHVVLTQTPSAPLKRRWDPAKAAREAASPVAEICLDFEKALARVKDLAGSGTIVVTGSTHTVGDALQGLGLAPFFDMDAPARRP